MLIVVCDHPQCMQKMELITAFQYATLQFTKALMEAGVRLYVQNASNTTSLRGAPSVNLTFVPIPQVYTSNATQTSHTTTMPPHVITHSTTTPPETTALQEQTALEELTTTVPDTWTTAAPFPSAEGSSPALPSAKTRAMNHLHMGILVLMVTMLLILVIVCCIRCVRTKRVKTVARRTRRHPSVHPPPNSGN